MASDDSSPQIRALRQCSAELVIALSAADLVMIPWTLFANKLIEQDTTEYCQLSAVTSTEKSSKIVSAVIKTVSTSPHFFESLVAVLLSETGNTALTSVGKKLQQTCSNFLSSDQSAEYHSESYRSPEKHKLVSCTNSLLTETPCHFHSLHMHPHQPAVIASPQQQSPICRYANYLRAIYKRSELPEYSNLSCYKWIPSPGEKFKFINLAVISKTKLSKDEQKKIKQEAIHGHVDMILKKKAPIALENILQVEQGQSLTCVLIEGAPGIGKSTLAWEICRRWGRGELFQKYSLVLLVTLRDERVQRAACVVDLFYHSDKKLQEGVAENIGEINGRSTLIILEGLDELPQHLLTGYSIFTDLLSGAIFPEATVLVTSRPSATDKLWQRWWQKKSRHIEILGFTEDKIDEYTKGILCDHQLSGFNDYLAIHPHIKSMMYVPLHCAIATVVYMQCLQSDTPPPKTLTGLYTSLTQTVLMQYIQDHPDHKYKKHQFNSFSDLPHSIYTHFKKLCHLAFDGVDKQQLIFCNLPQLLDTSQQFEHLGFMDAVPDLFSLSHQSANYSYNFLHLSVQEYLAANHISLMNHCEQEQLLQTIRYGDHRFNMTRFLAGITQFKGLDKVTVKNFLGISNIDRAKNSAELSHYTLEFLHECQDVSILDSEYCYSVNVRDSKTSLMALDYAVTTSSSKWNLIFSGFDSPYHLPGGIYTIEKIKFISCTPEFINSFLVQVPHHVLPHIRSFINENESPFPPLPDKIPQCIPRMEGLHTLKLDNTLHISLNSLIVMLCRCTPGLRTLSVCDCSEIFADGGKVPESLILQLRFSVPKLKSFSVMSRLGLDYFKIEFPDSADCGNIDIKCELSAPVIFEQFLQQLSQQTVSHIGSFKYHSGPDKREVNKISQKKEFFKSQPLPSCVPELIARMKELNTLTLKYVLDTSLSQLIPALPTLRNLSIISNIGSFNHTVDVDNSSDQPLSQLQPHRVNLEYEHTALGLEVFDHIILQLLIEKTLECIESFSCYSKNISGKYMYSGEGFLLPSLPKLILRMGRLKTLRLENVDETSLAELQLPTVPPLRNFYVGYADEAWFCYSMTNGKSNDSPLPQLQPCCFEISTYAFDLFPMYARVCDHALQLSLPENTLANVGSFRYNYDSKDDCGDYCYPMLPSLPKLILGMERLKTLELCIKDDTALEELVPTLLKVPTLTKLSIYTDVGGFSVSSSDTPLLELLPLHINLVSICVYNLKFFDGLLQQLLPERTAPTESSKCSDEVEYYLPLTKLIPRIERLNLLTLESLSLCGLTSENIAFLCQWLLTYQQKTLKLSSLSPEHTVISSRSFTTISSLKTLAMRWSEFTLHSMKIFVSMFQQKQSIIEMDIRSCAIDSDSACFFVETLQQNTTLRKLEMGKHTIGEKEALEIAKMLKHNTTLEELNLYKAKISGSGAIAVAEALHHNTTLKKLNMSKNPVGEKGALAIAEMLKYNTGLEELNFRCYDKTEIGDKATKALIVNLAMNQHLKKLTIYRGCEQLVESLPEYYAHKERVQLLQ